MFNLENKTLFITGCGSGIGLETAKAAIELGARVYGTVFSEEQSVTVKNCLPRECIYKVNVKNSDELTAALNDAVSHSGQLNGVVAVAGTLSLQPSIQTDDINWRNTIDTNLSGSFYLARAAIPYLERQKSSSIVFVSSQIGLVGHPIGAAYAASKAGISGLTKSMAVELASKSTRVNAVAPGPIISDMTAEARADRERYEALLADIPMGRFGEPKEIANVINFLLSEASSFITGQVIVADGGFTAH
jgi:NAD(P)-dependent dehydrogenase (short-subunit alcohol dehydrogenase family)